MRGNLGLQPVAGGKPHDLRRKPPDHDGSCEREHGAYSLQQPFESLTGHPKGEESGQMGEADRENEQGEQRDERALAGTALAPPPMDIEEGGRDDQKRKRDDAVGHGMKEDELGRPRFGLERQSTRT